jgi:hypothetical protein
MTALAGPVTRAPRPSIPIIFTCPMDPDVEQERPGACPKCGMSLTPIRVSYAWSCPVHKNVIVFDSGRCRVCQRKLESVTLLASWTCTVHKKVREGRPGRCRTCNRELVAIHERQDKLPAGT